MRDYAKLVEQVYVPDYAKLGEQVYYVPDYAKLGKQIYYRGTSLREKFLVF